MMWIAVCFCFAAHASAQSDAVPIAAPVPDATVAAENPPVDICVPEQINVHPQHQGVPLRLNDWLTLVISGACKTDVTNQLAMTNAAPGLTSQSSGISLLLNDVVMQDLPMVAAQGADASQMLLSFRLQRNSEDEPSRQSWTTFLRNGESCCQSTFDADEMGVSIALAIGNRAAAALGAAKNIQFRVEDRRVVVWTFWLLLIAFVLCYALAIRSPSLLREVPGGGYSLAKSQMAFWGLLVALSFSGIWFVVGTMEQIPNDVLILLGISAATGWLSPFAGDSSESNARSKLGAQQAQAVADVQKASAGTGDLEASTTRLTLVNAALQRLATRAHLRDIQGFLRDICSDGNGIGVHRVQAVAWTLILGVIFVCEVTTVISMPVFANNLLLLLGISNGTYLTLKTREQP